MKPKKILEKECLSGKNGIRDAQELLTGKWKFAIIAALHFEGIMRFMDLLRHIDGIAAKVLSKELKDLEINHLVLKTVCQTKPLTVEYELTEIAHDLGPLLIEMAKWGTRYRSFIIKEEIELA